MPVLYVNISIRGWWDNVSEEQEERHFEQPPKKDNWIQVHADQEYTVVVQLERTNSTSELKVHSPRFPRGKDEGWFLTLGSVETGELMALKRVSAVRSRRNLQHLTFFTPKMTGKNVHAEYCMLSQTVLYVIIRLVSRLKSYHPVCT
jgi:activating signal cointegrator complex subunit 3